MSTSLKPFHLEILSPERSFYRGACVSLIVPISDGMIGIQAGRAPAAIEDGEVRFTLPDGEQRVCAVADGMVDVSETDVHILCESALAPEEIDAEAERQKMEEARLALAERMAYKDYLLSQLTFARAFNKLRIKAKYAADPVDPQNNAL